jgi:hypothetical protein
MGLVFPEGIEIVQDYFIEVIKHAVFKQLSAFLNFQLLKTKDDPKNDDQNTHMTNAILDKMNEIFEGKKDYKSLKDYEKESFEKNISDKCSICDKTPVKDDVTGGRDGDEGELDDTSEKKNKDYTEYACKHKICKKCYLPNNFNLTHTIASKIASKKGPVIPCLQFFMTEVGEKVKINVNTSSSESTEFQFYNCCPICNSAKNPETPIPNILINNNYKPAAVKASDGFMKDIFDKKYKLKDCEVKGGRVTIKKKPLKRKSRKQNVKKKNRSRKRQHKTRKKRTLRRKALKIVKKRLIIGGTGTDKELTEDENQKITEVDININLNDGMKKMKMNKYNNNDEEKGKYKAMTDKLGKIKIDINDKLKLYEDACKKAATTAPAEAEEAKEAETAAAKTQSTYESDIDKIKEKTIERYRDEYRNFDSNYTKKMYEKEQKFKRNQEDIIKTKDSANQSSTPGDTSNTNNNNNNNPPVKNPMDTDPIKSYQKLQDQELNELQAAHKKDKEILQQQHKYDELLLLIDWYEYFLNELHTLMIEHPHIKDKDKKDLVNKKAQYNLNMKNNRTMKESGRNMMNKMSSTVNRIKQLYNQNKSVDGEEDEKEGSKGCCTRTPYHDAVTTFDQVYESCVAMIEGFFGVGDEGANNPIIEKVKKILISCIQTYLQFHLEKCMEEHIGTLLIKPPEENKKKGKFWGGVKNDSPETLPEAMTLVSDANVYVVPDGVPENVRPANYINADIYQDPNANKHTSTSAKINKYQSPVNKPSTDPENPKSTIPIVNNENSDQNINGQKPAEPPKSTTTHAEVIKNQVEKILNNNAIDRCIALHKKIDFKKWTLS